MEEESKGEPSKVESENNDQNQSPKKVVLTDEVAVFFVAKSSCCRDQHCLPPHPALRLWTHMTHRCIVDSARVLVFIL